MYVCAFMSVKRTTSSPVEMCCHNIQALAETTESPLFNFIEQINPSQTCHKTIIL